MSKKKPGKGIKYLLVIAGFFLGLYIVFVLANSWIIPSMIHDSDSIEVPDLNGMALDDAKTKLAMLDIRSKIASEQFVDGVPPGQVINQSPAPGTFVKSGRLINLVVSKTGKQITVPQLCGRPLRQVRIALMRRGLHLGNISYDYCDSVKKDHIVTQSIKARRGANLGSTIDVLVSKGAHNQIMVPRLIGLTIENAEKILNESGLFLGVVDYIQSGTFQAGTVIGQAPPEQEIVKENSLVNIKVSK